MTRADIITALLRITADAFHPSSVYGYELPLDAPTLDLARDTLSSYSTDLLISLHMSATAPKQEDRNGNFLMANEGRSESYVRTYLVLAEDNNDLFADYAYNFSAMSATHSLALYPTLSYEDTREYYQKVVALTGTVCAIQNAILSESHYEHDDPRLLRYAPDPEDDTGVDRLACIASDKLVELILTRSSDWHEISDIVIERKTDDTEVILAIMNSDDIKPMSKGRL